MPRWGDCGIRLQVTPPGATHDPAGRFQRSEDEVAVVEIGYGDTLEDEDVGAVFDDGVMVDLHDAKVRHAVHPGAGSHRSGRDRPGSR